jgi:hypothetical protein
MMFWGDISGENAWAQCYRKNGSALHHISGNFKRSSGRSVLRGVTASKTLRNSLNEYRRTVEDDDDNLFLDSKMP